MNFTNRFNFKNLIVYYHFYITYVPNKSFINLNAFRFLEEESFNKNIKL